MEDEAVLMSVRSVLTVGIIDASVSYIAGEDETANARRA